jgi:ankyrin repeat protein
MLLSVNVNLNVKDQQGNTALLEAARNGQEEIITLLMSRGARLNMDSQLQVWACTAPAGGGGAGGAAVTLHVVCGQCVHPAHWHEGSKAVQGCTMTGAASTDPRG